LCRNFPVQIFTGFVRLVFLSLNKPLISQGLFAIAKDFSKTFFHWYRACKGNSRVGQKFPPDKKQTNKMNYEKN